MEGKKGIYNEIKEENDKTKEQINYWRNELSSLSVNKSFPICGYVQNGKGSKISEMNFKIEDGTTEKIVNLANKSEAGTYLILLSAVQYLLSIYCGSEEVVTGVPAYGGKGSIYPFKLYVNYNDSFKEFLIKIKAKFMEISKYSALINEEIYKELELKSGDKELLDTIVVSETLHKHVKKDNLKAKIIFIFNIHQERIELKIKYNSILYTEETIQGIWNHLSMYLKSVIQNTRIKLSDIQILTEKEKHKLLYEFNDTYAYYPKDKTIHELFEEQVEKTPDSIAVIYEDIKLTYKELNEKSNSIARILRKKGVIANSIVGIMVERSPKMIIGIIGILKAGGAYLPIDPEYPKDRIKYMLDDSNTKVLLCQNKLLNKIQFGGQVVDLEDTELYNKESANLEIINKSTDLAYIIYTSGSTGKPKGVMIEHYSVINRLNWMQKRYSIDECDVLLQKTPFTFDVSVWELFWWSLQGARVSLLKPGGEKEPETIIKTIEKNKVTVMHFVPSMLNIFLTYVDEHNSRSRIGSIKQIFCSGEALSLNQVEQFNKLLFKVNKTKLSNLYGPTEATVDVSYFDCSAGEKLKNIPIGKPIDNIRLYIVDKHMNLQPVGIAGELCISGDGLARGYINNPELTEEKFIENPFISAEKMYKTGDLARWLPDGNIQFIGRIDNQVKVRGFRIELGEIEERLSSYDSIKEAAVIAKQDEDGDKYLCAYIVLKEKVAISEVRSFLLTQLPNYMIPSYFFQLEMMPLTSSGKIDRKALYSLNGESEKDIQYEEASTEIQKKLVDIWKNVLHARRVGIEDNFFQIGGHSLKATKLISSIYKEFGVELSLSDIFKFSTIKRLALHIDSLEKNHCYPIYKAPKASYYTATAEQKRIYLAHQVDDTGISYNVPVFIEISGKLDTNKLANSFKKLIDRHESLRTSFRYEDGELVQVINTNVELMINKEEFNEYEVEERLQKFIKPFDLSKAPLIKVSIGKIKEDKYILMIDIHHIVVDGISINTIINELGKLYENEELPDLNLQYKDYSIWQKQMLNTKWNEKQEKYWIDVLKGEIPILNMPSDYSKMLKSSAKGNYIKFELDCEITDAIRDICKAEGATVYMVLLAAYNVLLSKYTAQEDIIIGTPTAGRVHPDLYNVVGMFVNSLPMRNCPSGDKSFKDFLSELKNNTINAFDNQAYQLENLIDRLNFKKTNFGSLLFNTMFVFKNYEDFQLDIKGLICKEYSFFGNTSQFDILLEVEEKEKEIECVFEYRSKVFKEDTIERMCQHFNSILKNVIKNINIKISEIYLLTEKERKQILCEFNDTKTDYPQNKTIQELFEEQVEKTPNNIAVVFQDKKLTYKELNKKSNQLARVLRNMGIKTNSIVGIMVERSLEMIIGIIGILKTGGAYLPIDPSCPKERIEYMLNDSTSSALLSTESLLNSIEFNGKIIDLFCDHLFKGNSNNLKKINESSDLAYIIYTSGTTGNPKGVAINHFNIINTILWRKKYYKFDESDVILQIPSFSFDSSVEDILTALISGARLVIINQDKRLDADYLKETILNNNVSNFLVTPAFYNTLLGYCLSEVKTLKKITVAGEDIKQECVKKHFKVLSNVKLFNEYGPTENSVCSTIYEFNNESSKVLIGKPIANTKIYILDKSMNIVPIGVAGELCISGVGLARGYLNNTELTAEKFIENPFELGTKMYKTGDLVRWMKDGNIEFLGRIDNQVKIRGFRIELGEIENQLLHHEEINEVVVIDREDENENKYLCAYIVAKKQLAVKELREFLSVRLPSYMIPSYIVQLEKIPLTSNGKIDRNKLTSSNNKMEYSSDYERTSNATEEKLSKIWQKIFKLNEVGVNHNFFELGGHSLKAIELISMIQKEFKIIVPVSMVFKKQTIKELAEYIENEIQNIYPTIDVVEKKEYYTTSSAQKRMFILNQLYPDNLGYNVSDVKIVEGELSISRVENAFIEIIKRHDSLRTSFDIVNDEIIQRIHPSVNFKVQYIENYGKNERDLVKENIISFNLSEAPLIRVKLIKLDINRHMLIIDTHHSISDGISMRIIMKEFETFYNGQTLPELKLQYKDYSAWQEKLLNSSVLEKQKTYWMNIYKNNIPQLALPKDYFFDNSNGFSGEILKFGIKSDLVYKLNELVQRLSVNTFSILLAGYKILLSKVCEQEDIVVGIPVSGRHYMGTKDIIGMFVNTLAIRSYPKGNKSIIEYINEVYNTILDAYDNQDYQFDELVDNLQIEREYGKNTLFNTMFSMLEGQVASPKIQDLTFKQVFITEEDCLFDISLDALILQDEIEFVYQYNKALFKKETIIKFSNGYINILSCIANCGAKRLKDIEILNYNHL